MSGVTLKTRVSNVKSVALTALELWAFNAQNFLGHMTQTKSLFWKIFKG